jgi:hypothetical protein
MTIPPKGSDGTASVTNGPVISSTRGERSGNRWRSEVAIPAMTAEAEIIRDAVVLPAAPR